VASKFSKHDRGFDMDKGGMGVVCRSNVGTRVERGGQEVLVCSSLTAGLEPAKAALSVSGSAVSAHS
jgi:hypothetical protein